MRYFKDRIAHVLAHVNPTNGKKWAESSEYIFASEAQNEAMRQQENTSALTSWQYTMAQAIKDNLSTSTNILVTTGGGAYLANSLLDAYFDCSALDILAIHAYGTDDFSPTSSKNTDAGNNDCNGGNALDSGTRDSNIKEWAASIIAAGIPWLYSQILPNAKFLAKKWSGIL
ncbi:hypothetical protein BDW69DRAFT_183581 [Aspergillus filifer]